MKTKPRTEWNVLPGLLAAERMPGQGDRDDFNRLDLGFDAATLEEFLKDPIAAILKVVKKELADRATAKNPPDDRATAKNSPEALLTTLVVRTGKVLVMAERERAQEEERLKHGC